MQELTPREAFELLEGSPVGHLGVIDGDVLYVTPMSYVPMEGGAFMRTGPGRRLDAIEANPGVCVEVARFDLQTGHWKSVIAWGRAAVVSDPRLEEGLIAGLSIKHRDQMGSALTTSWIPCRLPLGHHPHGHRNDHRALVGN